MAEEIFRKKSLDKIKSPESLNDYVRVSNAGIWLVLVAVIVLLAGACVWGIFGHIDTKVKTAAVAENGTLSCIVRDADVNVGMKIIVDDTECYISEVNYDEQTGGQFCAVKAKTDLSDGKYEAEIITESISPISFVLN